MQKNALKAICPATNDVLLKVLAGYYSNREGVSPSNDTRDEFLRVLVLKSLIHIVHVVHRCAPDQVSHFYSGFTQAKKHEVISKKILWRLGIIRWSETAPK